VTSLLNFGLFLIYTILLKTKHLVGATARPVFHFLNIAANFRWSCQWSSGRIEPSTNSVFVCSPRQGVRGGSVTYMMIVLLLFLQKQNLANAIYLFGLGTLLSGLGLGKEPKETC